MAKNSGAYDAQKEYTSEIGGWRGVFLSPMTLLRS